MPTVVTITHTYPKPDGVTPAAGTVTFTPLVPIPVGDETVARVPVKVDLDASGSFSVDLVATTDSDLLGAAYEVRESFVGDTRGANRYYIEVPASQPSYNLNDLTKIGATPTINIPTPGPQGDPGPVGPDGNINVVADYSALRALAAGSYAHVQIKGASTHLTGILGQFAWDSESTATDDGGTVIKPSGVSGGSPGRWIRLNRDDAFNVDWFGAAGDGVADDTAAVNAARTAAIAANKPLLFTPGKTYAIDQLAHWDGGVIIAHGAVIVHNASVAKPLLLLGNQGAIGVGAHQRSRVYGGTWKAQQTVTGRTTAIVYMYGLWHGHLMDMELFGGTSTADTTKRATYGLWVVGRGAKTSVRGSGGTYYNHIQNVYIHGAASHGVNLDGWDTDGDTPSSSVGSYLNVNHWHNITIKRCGGDGVYIEGSSAGKWDIVDCEGNTGYGLHVYQHMRTEQFDAFHAETNNSNGQQVYVERVGVNSDSASQKSNVMFGTMTNSPLPSTDELDWWAVYKNATNVYYSQRMNWRNGMQSWMTATNLFSMSHYVDGDTQPRVVVRPDGYTLYGPGSGSTPTASDNTYTRYNTTSYDIGSALQLKALGGFSVGALGTKLVQGRKQSLAVLPGTVPANSTTDKTVTITGATLGDIVIANPNPSLEAGLIFGGAWVSATNTITIRIANVTGASVVGSSRAWDIELRQYS